MSIIEFYVSVDDADKVAAVYDRIDVFRSPNQDGSPNPYAAITADSPTTAVLDGTVTGPWNLNGQTLNIVLDSAESVPVAFTGTNPLSLRQVLDKLNTAFPGYAALASETSQDSEKIRLTSPTAGTESVIQVSGPAATTLGLSTLRTNGKGARLLLSSNTNSYLFRDYDGESSLWYKTRYINTTTGAVSNFSDPFQAGEGQALPDSVVVTGSIALADVTGAPIVGRRIIIVVSSSVQMVSNGAGVNYGILPSVDRIEVATDRDGKASVKLVKGQTVKAFIEGTRFEREFTVPTADFDILAVATTKPDPLDIVTAPPMPIRVS